MRFTSINIPAVLATVFFIVVIQSSCAGDTATAQKKQFNPAPTPEEDDWLPSRTARSFPADLPADLPAKAIRLVPSTISEDIVKYKNDNRVATAKDIAEYGNSLLPVKGYNYWIDIGELIQKKEKEATILSEDMQAFPFSMKLSTGRVEDFTLFATRYDSCCCGYTYADFPVTKISWSVITLRANGKTYSVDRPKEFGHNEVYALVDIKNPSKALRKWQIPYETYPQAISADGRKLYVEAPVDEILLEIDHNGTFRFVDKDISRSPKGEQCSIPINPKDHYEDCLKFKVARKTFYIKYSGVCT